MGFKAVLGGAARRYSENLDEKELGCKTEFQRIESIF